MLDEDRDFIGDMNAWISKFIVDEDYVAAEQASLLLDQLRSDDPDLLAGYLDAVALAILTQRLGQKRTARARAASRGKGAFRAALAAHEAGDDRPLSVFAEHLVVDGQRVSRAIGRMTREDHQYVASRQGARSKAAAMQEQFHNAIASKIAPGLTTADVISEDDYVVLYNSIVQV